MNELEKEEMLSILQGIEKMKEYIDKNFKDLKAIRPVYFNEHKFQSILLRIIENQQKTSNMLDFICNYLLHKDKPEDRPNLAYKDMIDNTIKESSLGLYDKFFPEKSKGKKKTKSKKSRKKNKK